MAEEKRQLIRGLTLTDTTALVIGTVIGSGIFIKTAIMTQEAGSPLVVLLAWVAAGILSLAGALTYAELGALLPHAGGEYVYLRKAYGEVAAFFYGWMRFVVGSTGSIAIIATGFATFLSAVYPLETVWFRSEFKFVGDAPIKWQFGTLQLTAILAIWAISLVNSFTVAFGGKVQSLLTVLKIGGLLAVIFGVFFFAGTPRWSNLATPAGTPAWGGVGVFGAALLAALWAYDGWNNMPMAAGEVKDPGRNVPRALIFGMIVVTIIYCLVNLAYFYALPYAEVVTSNSTKYRDALPIAAKTAISAFGSFGGKLIAVSFIISALGALNGSVLTGARVPYAMANDGVFFSKAAFLNEKSRVPVYAILIQAIWASVLAISGTFDQLSDYVVFASFIFYALTTSAVFILRKKMKDVPRPYKTLGYPYVPAAFILMSVLLLINTLIKRPDESVAGLVLIFMGIPVYLYYYMQKKRISGEAIGNRQ